MRLKLPIGISSFEEIRTGGYYYVDKTHFVLKLSESGKYFFLSRPRRFGKSLFLDTLKQAFLGRKDLFEGLFLHNHWDWSKTYPVIHLDFAGGMARNPEALQKWILLQLKRNQENLEITCEDTSDYRACFEELILKTYKKSGKKVVVLIDEYDKPILDRIEERETAKEMREILKNLYSVLKPLDQYLKLVFITGVTKFSKVSLFSGLNQLQDISLHPDFAEICGYTQEELETVFAEELRDKDLEAIKCWYNGYSFCGRPLYNPFDVLLFLSEGKFRPYWFETGTPESLIKLLIEKAFPIPQLEELIVTEDLIGSFDIDFIEPENLLFQTGYLTIKRCENSPTGEIFYLGYPNKEVKVALNRKILYFLTNSTQPGRLSIEAIEILSRGDLSSLEKLLKSLFAGIPSDWHRRNEIAKYEGYYVSVIYSFFAGAGLNLIPEDTVSTGKIDLTVLHNERAYIFEFKVLSKGEKKGKALSQLREKGYHQKYLSTCREIYLIGIEFNRAKRQIETFAWERILP